MVTRTETSATDGNDLLPVAGAGAAALLLLGGGAAMMVSRRRRREAHEADVYDSEHDALPPDPFADGAQPQHVPVMATAPAMAAPAMPRSEPEPGFARDPIFDSVPEATDGRDPTLPPVSAASRYGRHVQAAMRGPTPDNPSQSLKKRLRRAAFFDMRERQALDAGEAGTAMPEAAAEPAMAERTDTVRTAPPVAPRRPAIPRPNSAPMFGYRPAFQS